MQPAAFPRRVFETQLNSRVLELPLGSGWNVTRLGTFLSLFVCNPIFFQTIGAEVIGVAGCFITSSSA